ncbi:MAG: galactokinase [Chitinophagaceae bacterium]|nr:galactokinase [Chitinophagaceae bacterium]
MPSSSERVLTTFAAKFTTTPRLYFAPGRINLIGEHVDYNDGFVMPAAINKGIWYAVAPNTTNTASFYSTDLHESLSIEVTNVHKMDGWKNYVLGIMDQVQKAGYVIGGFDCVFGGNLPVGAGMSSSAAVECGLLVALNDLFQYGLDRVTIAKMAQKAEHTYPGVQCGIMDMFANMMGKMDHVILLNCMNLDFKYLPLPLTEYSIILINTKVHHSLAGSAYNERRNECAEGFKILKLLVPEVTSWQDLSRADVEKNKAQLPENIYKRSLYVTGEIERTLKASKHLENHELKQFGKLMFETHEGLSKLYEVSCPELDFLVEQAKKFPAIIGSRLMGGGFGGCTINLIKISEWGAITQTILKEYKAAFNIDAEVYDMALSDGTYEAV